MREGEIVGRRFELVAHAAAGGMGTVFRARDLRTQEFVALKTCRLDLAAERDHSTRSAQLERLFARFEREARALAEVSDAAIVRYVTHGMSEEGEPFLVMAWVDGESLAERLLRSGLSVREALQLGGDLTRALSRLHEQGIVHRDLKPANVMLRHKDPRQAVLVDFGVARRAETASVTLSGARVGTLLYMAPEQIRDPRRVDGRADVFALGCVLFECLTGTRAFDADDALATLARILLDQAPQPQAFRPDLPDGVARLVERLLARTPEQRPQAGPALEREFAALADGPEQAALGPPETEPRVPATLDVQVPAATVEAASARGPTRPPAGAQPPAWSESEIEPSQNHERRRAHETDRFVGRSEELAHLSALVDSGAKLLVLWGPAGIGKTRLVLEAAGRGGKRFDLLEFADLGQARDLDDVIRIVAHRLAASTRGGEGPEQLIARTLGRLGRRVVVLDRVEHLSHELGNVIDAWRRTAPDVCFVVTSRERLEWNEAVSLEVGPLSLLRARTELAESSALSPAAELFVERVRKSEPEFRLSAETTRGVESAVALLEGIPLAIELAAARVGLLGLEGVLQRLSKQLDLLGQSPATRAGGPVSMRAALRASVELLSEVERRAFAQCAVFAGSFTARAAEAVLDGPADSVLATLQSLRKKSLLASDPESPEDDRRLYVFSVVREYALSELVAFGGEALLRARHGAYYIRRARELSQRSRERDTLKAIERDAENLIAAVDWALFKPEPEVRLGLEALLALEPVITARGPLPAFLRLIEAGLARAAGFAHGPELLSGARVRQLRARLAATSGRFDQARGDLEQVLVIARAHDDRTLEAACLLDLGVSHHFQRSLQAARDCYERALALLAPASNPELEARCYGNLGAILHDGEHFTEAAAYYWRAIHLLEKTGERRMRGNFLNNLGVLEQELGEPQRARGHFRDSLTLLTDVGDARLQAITLGNLGVLEQLDADWANAQKCHERALELLEPLDDPRSEALCRARLGATLALLGELEQADALLNRALALSRGGESSHTEAIHLHRAFHHVALGERDLRSADPRAAAARLDRARELAAHAAHGDSATPSPAKLSDDVRATLRILHPLLDQLDRKISGATAVSS